jgi:hypothetical protein
MSADDSRVRRPSYSAKQESRGRRPSMCLHYQPAVLAPQEHRRSHEAHANDGDPYRVRGEHGQSEWDEACRVHERAGWEHDSSAGDELCLRQRLRPQGPFRRRPLLRARRRFPPATIPNQSRSSTTSSRSGMASSPTRNPKPRHIRCRDKLPSCRTRKDRSRRPLQWPAATPYPGRGRYTSFHWRPDRTSRSLDLLRNRRARSYGLTLHRPRPDRARGSTRPRNPVQGPETRNTGCCRRRRLSATRRRGHLSCTRPPEAYWRVQPAPCHRRPKSSRAADRDRCGSWHSQPVRLVPRPRRRCKNTWMTRATRHK